jgi:hypothetical protein
MFIDLFLLLRLVLTILFISLQLRDWVKASGCGALYLASDASVAEVALIANAAKGIITQRGCPTALCQTSATVTAAVNVEVLSVLPKFLGEVWQGDELSQLVALSRREKSLPTDVFKRDMENKT